MKKRIDILEDDIAELDPRLLRKLLQDKTTKKNIFWETKDYESYGSQYDEHAEMKVELITGDFFNVIQPRAAKSKKSKKRELRKEQKSSHHLGFATNRTIRWMKHGSDDQIVFLPRDERRKQSNLTFRDE